MNVGSLFSGIGGMDAGLARAGLAHAFFCESDEWRREVLAARWPGVPIYDDVRNVAARGDDVHWRGNTARAKVGRDAPGLTDPVDLLCGGFPCQDISVAGRRAGLAGARSGLFHEFARIVDAFRPRWLLVENVPGLLSSNGGRDFGVVLGTLADLGYGVAWRILNSRYFGVPQRRRRVFIVGAVAVDDPRAAAERAGQVLAVGSRCPGHPPTGSQTGPDVAGTLGGGSGERGWAQDVERMTFLPVAHSLLSSGGNDKHDPSLQTYVAGVGAPAGIAGVRRLTPRECERLQGLPDDWTRIDPKTPDSKRYSGLGDAVTANVAQWIGARIMAA